MGLERRKAGIRILAALAIAAGIFCLPKVETPETPKGSGQLVSIQELPDNGEMCLPESASDDPNLMAELEKKILLAAFPIRPVFAAFGDVGGTTELTRPPLRTLLDTAPGYVAVAVNTRTDEVFLQDSNTWSIRIFNRLENTPPSATRTEPKRVITGPTSEIQYNSHIYIDPNNGDIYSVENDTGDRIVVFSQNAEGDPKPLRKLKVGHRAYQMAVDEGTQELYVSVQSPPHVEVYRKIASGDEKPLRLIQGKSTRLR